MRASSSSSPDGGSGGYGQGHTYVGFLTTDASGNFSGSCRGSALPRATAWWARPRTGNNTSEFGPNVLVNTTLACA